jgi:arsenate reductase-like glutaredoxin family protein
VQKAQGFLGKVAHEFVKTEDAAKVRKGPAEALELASKAKKLVAAKGKGVTRLDLGKKGANPEEITSLMMGPTGNMRAPTLLVGDTLLVGFNEEAYTEVFGA